MPEQGNSIFVLSRSESSTVKLVKHLTGYHTQNVREGICVGQSTSTPVGRALIVDRSNPTLQAGKLFVSQDQTCSSAHDPLNSPW